MIRALDAGDLATALRVHRRLVPAVRAIMMSGEPGATMAKAAVQAAGVIAGRTMRLPLVTATDAQVEALRAALAEAGLA
jgi:4-hydroxy-tetrahydrodipicolinate synthase